MAYFKDLREYLQYLEVNGKLRVIDAQIDKDTELHPLVRWQFRGLPEKERTGFLFNNLKGINGEKYNCRVATSILGASREVYGMGMQCKPEDISAKWVGAYRNPIPPLLLSSGPVKEEIHMGDNLLEHQGLLEFAVPFSTNGWESQPRMTAISWHSMDPETGTINIGTYNGTVQGPTRACCRATSSQTHLHLNWNKYRQMGRPMPVAAVLGAVPAVSMASVTRIPYGVSELNIAGGLAGEPIPVVKCETSDLLVPAYAEIVLEGEIPIDYLEEDTASGENTGYTIIDHLVFSFRLKAVTHRHNPIWHDFISQMPPSESSTLRGIGSEGRLLDLLKSGCGISQVKDVAFHDCGSAHRICVIRMRDVSGVRTHNSTIWQALYASMGMLTGWPKMVIAVDEDIDPWDLESVFWAVSFRYQPHRDTQIVHGRQANLDQSAGPYTMPDAERWYPTSRTGPQGNSAILMDATRKWDYTPVALPKKDYMDKAKAIWEQLGLPELNPKMPWYGISLGIWPEKYERQARLAEEGKFDEVAREILDNPVTPIPEDF